MNRNPYFDYIDERLHVLARRIETRGKLNMLDLHLHSENFYMHFFNLLYGYQLENLNSKMQNVEAIDLIDHTNKVIIQVSATCTKQKIESALTKQILNNYKNYAFKFISISKDASNIRKNTFKNPFSLTFMPSSDVFDITSLLNDILSKKAEVIKVIYKFIKDELGGEVDVVRLDSNLASVINTLSKEKWDETNEGESINSFEIERKITHNELKDSKEIIDEYCVFYKKVDEKYSEFDTLGVNKSSSVLRSIRKEYRNLKNSGTPDFVFQSVVEKVKEKILESPNFERIPIDELELCVDILVVDAFIRCKIFENPQNYNYATS
ncbi:ABC-three component system protein [Plebeiibacterium sediminum]|uniref:SMEK domain-containing protein n=1 Tax=Plebeiibacterium sediminum TaxID=2992112 RepID=A0AAE3M922_9BACT|nr:ABC-three component system protein [Plebeiobacterium sediminum]MCW3789379.1 SMEK domain-containing protein [Plebeiobacterium sediminum]